MIFRRCLLIGLSLLVGIGIWCLSPWPDSAPKPPEPDNLTQNPTYAISTTINLCIADKPQVAREYAELAHTMKPMSYGSESRRAYELALQISPKQVNWKLHLAIAAREKGDFEKYQALLQELAVADNVRATVYHRLGYVQLESSNLNEASVLFERALRMSPVCSRSVCGPGRCTTSTRSN